MTLASAYLTSEFASGSKPARFVLDTPLVIAMLVLLVLGLVMVGSASLGVAQHDFGDPFHYLWRQSAYVLVALTLGVGAFFVPMGFWQKAGPVLIVGAALVLMLVFVPGLGTEVKGSRRWLNLGLFNLQASELAKFFVIIYLAGYLVRHAEAVRSSLAGFLRPLILLAFLVVLLLLEPDYGAAAVMLATAMGMMWLAGARMSQFILLMLILFAMLAAVALLESYRIDRLTVFLDPWQDPFRKGFQLTQALIAFGRGDLFGVGLGSGIQKLFYLPEAHTDFLLAVIGEELGLVGVLAVIGLFLVLIHRIFHIGREAEKRDHAFAAWLCYGIGLWVGLQAIINMGVNMGVLPTKGLTLPLMSYGGSSLVVTCVALAIVLRTFHELHRYDRASQRRVKRT